MKNIISSLIVAIMLVGCASTKNIAPNELVELKENEGIVVFEILGAEEVVVARGELLGDTFTSGAEEITGPPESRYYVRKLKALAGNSAYGFDKIRKGDVELSACGNEDNRITGFEIKPGQAIYLGAFTVRHSKKAREGVISRSRSDDLEKVAYLEITQDLNSAKKFFTKTYPKINIPLVQGTLKSFRQGHCPVTYNYYYY